MPRTVTKHLDGNSEYFYSSGNLYRAVLSVATGGELTASGLNLRVLGAGYFNSGLYVSGNPVLTGLNAESLATTGTRWSELGSAARVATFSTAFMGAAVNNSGWWRIAEARTNGGLPPTFNAFVTFTSVNYNFLFYVTHGNNTGASITLLGQHGQESNPLIYFTGIRLVRNTGSKIHYVDIGTSTGNWSSTYVLTVQNFDAYSKISNAYDRLVPLTGSRAANNLPSDEFVDTYLRLDNQTIIGAASNVQHPNLFRVDASGVYYRDQLLTTGTNASVSLPSNLVTGAGTATYIPLWTSQSGLTNSHIEESAIGNNLFSLTSAETYSSLATARSTSDYTFAPFATGNIILNDYRSLAIDQFYLAFQGNSPSQTTVSLAAGNLFGQQLFLTVKSGACTIKNTGTAIHLISDWVARSGSSLKLHWDDDAGIWREEYRFPMSASGILPANTITGAGTAGQIPMWVSPSGINNTNLTYTAGSPGLFSSFPSVYTSCATAKKTTEYVDYLLNNNTINVFNSSAVELVGFQATGATLHLANGTLEGQQLLLYSYSGTGYIFNTGNRILSSDWVATTGSLIKLYWDNSRGKWREEYRFPSSGNSFADPSSSIGLTAVNGTAVTAMRSDAAPALDQSIAPTWTSSHTWSNGQSTQYYSAGNTFLSKINNNISGELQIESAGLFLSGVGNYLSIGTGRNENFCVWINNSITGVVDASFSTFNSAKGLFVNPTINNRQNGGVIYGIEIQPVFQNCTGSSVGLLIKNPRVQGSANMVLNYGLYIENLTGTSATPLWVEGTGRNSFIQSNLFLGNAQGVGANSNNVLWIEGAASNSVNTIARQMVNVYSRLTSVTGDVGAGIALGGHRLAGLSSATAVFGSIEGRKENHITGDSQGYLCFITPNLINGAYTEAMRITSKKNVVIGGSGASAQWSPIPITGSDGFLYIPGTTGVPNGTPTSYGSTVPLVYDNYGKVLYAYSSGWQVISGGGGNTSFDNPTATVGLTATNGASTSAMRADAAPALSQAIVPTWTATHTFNRANVFAYNVLNSTGINCQTGIHVKNITGAETYRFENTPSAGTMSFITVRFYNSGTGSYTPAFTGASFVTPLGSISSGRYGEYTFAVYGDGVIHGVEQRSFA